RRALDPDLRRHTGHGAAGRHPDPDRAAARRRRLPPAGSLRAAADRPLETAARPCDRGAGAGLPAGPRRLPARSAACPGAAAVTAVLQVEGLRKAFGGVVAVADVSFEVAAGQLFAIIGPKGAGKTTCFNMVGGQLKPDGGRVHLAGRDVTGEPPRRIWRLG